MYETALPTFEGIQPVGTIVKISGSSGRRTRPYRIGEKVVLVVEVEVVGIDHSHTKGGVARLHKTVTNDVYELGGDRAPDLIETLAEEFRLNFGDGTPTTLFDHQPEAGLDEYDAEVHGEPEPGDCYLVEGKAARWDVVAEAGADPDEVGDLASDVELDGDGLIAGDVFGWVDLDAYGGSSTFGFDERERVRQYRDDSSPPEIVEAILVTKASAATAGEWIRSVADDDVVETVRGDPDEGISWSPSLGTDRTVGFDEYLVLAGGSFVPYSADVFADLFPTLVAEDEPTVEETEDDEAEPTTEEVELDDEAEGPAEA